MTASAGSPSCPAEAPGPAPVAAPSPSAGRFRRVRAATESLARPLSPEDCAIQSMPDVSPTKWHLAHTSWFFETFLLERNLPGFRPFHPSFRILFNSYYETVGARHPRPRRGLLSRPGLEEILAYRRYVDEKMESLLVRGDDPGGEIARVTEIGLQHEQQHQELLLMDIKHVLSCNPTHPAYRDCPPPPGREAPPLRWHAYPEGPFRIGHDGPGFAYDNEMPGHRVHLREFEIGSRLVTNGEFLEFLADGGYRTPGLWLFDGIDTVRREGWDAPLYWVRRDGVWLQVTLSGLRELRPAEPVCHLSYYEADAYARWAGARLPTEAEWERAAADLPPAGNFLENGHLHPAPAGAGGDAPAQLYGDLWEWTASPYAPYPGYRPPPGALGEYNGKFMCNQMVLRGGCCTTPRGHIRLTYRNFYYPGQRWMFSGFRLAK